MRTFALVITIVTALTAPAVAEEEPEFTPMPKRSIGIGFQAHTTRIGGRSESGFGPSLELALGRGRWQMFAEGTIASAVMDTWTSPVEMSRVEGRVLHGAAGLRWLARQFSIDDHAGIEMFLLSALGAQRFYFHDGGRLTRPELALGFGIQGRLYKRPRLAFRMDLRAVFTPNSRESELVSCRGNCMTETGSSTGFLMGMAIAW